MIKYRPHRETLEESMKNMKEFNSIDEMYNHIVSEWNNSNNKLFEKEDLSITENKAVDNRINWKETRYICTKRFGDKIYEEPVCIGMCSIE